MFRSFGRIQFIKWLAEHPGEVRFKRWLDGNASEVLAEVGVTTGQVVLVFGCGSGTYTIPAAKWWEKEKSLCFRFLKSCRYAFLPV